MQFRLRSTLSLALGLAVTLGTAVSHAEAQSLVALTTNTPAGAPESLIEVGLNQCSVINRCAPNNFPAPTSPRAGGTAHDPRTGGTWISNGRMIAKVDPDGCRYQCPPFAIPTPQGVRLEIGGLAFYETQDTLLVLDTAGAIIKLQVRDCQVQQVSRCAITLPVLPGQAFSGLAVDEATGLVFWSVSDFGGSSPLQVVHVAQWATPCDPICSFRVTSCSPQLHPLGGITGLAFDPCERQLYVTDGRIMVRGDFVRNALGGCRLENLHCCVPSAIGSGLLGAIGLCIRPAQGVEHGDSCANGSCRPCGSLRLRMTGDPSIGNGDFGFQLLDAPVGARAFLGIGIGPCAAPGVRIPGFCGPLTLPLAPDAPIFIGPRPTLSATGQQCSGSARWGISIPNSVALCGDVFSAQAIVLCPSALAFGTAMTKCTQFRIGGS